MSWNSDRRQLAAEGLTPDQVEAEIARRKARRAANKAVRKRIEAQRQADRDAYRAALAEQETALYPDDTGYRLTSIDSTLTGTARATGKTAQSIRKGRAITKWEHDR